MASWKVKVRLILYHKGKILLLKQLKVKGGNYTLVGGNVEPYESPKEALVRESFEEAGLIINPVDLKLVHILYKKSGGEQRVVFYFKAFSWEGNLKAKETHKFKEAEWFDLERLPSKLTTTVRQALNAYRDGKMYSEFPF
jgi:ADP-ribose pyrophosphatase YjhB (NUDIX family)